MSIPDPLKLTVSKALGRVPSGVYILSSAHGGRDAAMMASWVQQAAFEPPAVSIAMAKDRPIREMILTSRRLALAVVGENGSALMKKYARGIPPGQDPFDGVTTLQTEGGLKVPAEALAYLDCTLMEVLEFGGDHDLFLARVDAGKLLREGASFTHLRGNGFHY